MSELFAGVGILQRALDYHLQRHNLIASNVANVDTPGFRPLELLREAEETGARLRLEATHHGHLRPGGGRPGDAVVVEDPSVQPGNDGNAVSLEREMSKLAANDLRYRSSARIVARQLGMLRYAANDGQG